MGIIFEVTGKSKRKIHLSKERWHHITIAHPEMANYLDKIQETVEKPLKTTPHSAKGDLRFYYTYQKHRNHPEKYLRLIIKYLNGKGFIVTAQFVRNIR